MLRHICRRQVSRRIPLCLSGVREAHAPPATDVDWDSLGFSFNASKMMYVAQGPAGSPLPRGSLRPYGPLELEPAATVLNYGQALFEGVKAFRTVDDRIVLFRPHMNAARMAKGARRFLMAELSQDTFMHGVCSVVCANSAWVPPVGKGSLYVRPIYFGSGAALGVAPSPSYTFAVFTNPVGNYFGGGGGNPTPIRLATTTEIHRAAPKGVGGTKAAGNYAPGFAVQKAVKAAGYSEVLFLDAKHERYVEEAGAANFFYVSRDGTTLHTPPLGTILPGVTRDSVLQLATEHGLEVVEAPVDIESVLTASEAFCSGTAAVVVPVGSITHRGKTCTFGDEAGPVTQALYSKLTGIQVGRVPDDHGWLYEVQDVTTE